MTPNDIPQHTRFPLVVKCGLHGYYLAHTGGAYLEPIRDQADPQGGALWFPTMEGAQYAKLLAEGVTARMIRASLGEV